MKCGCTCITKDTGGSQKQPRWERRRSYTETYTYRELTEKPKVEKSLGERLRERQRWREALKRTQALKSCVEQRMKRET